MYLSPALAQPKRGAGGAEGAELGKKMNMDGASMPAISPHLSFCNR